MADNTTLPGSGEVYAADSIKDADDVEIKHQRVKISVGPPDTAGDLSPEIPAPVTGAQLEDICQQLRVMNVHLAQISGLEVGPE